MRPLAEFPPEQAAVVVGVLTDIDDTLTTEGRLTAAAYAALEALHAAGLKVIPVTGRPAGWCDHIARMWPVDAVVGENGAFWMRHDPAAKKLRTVFAGDVPADRQARIDALARDILAAVPGCALASDQFCRIADLAIDFREDVPPLPRSAVDEIVWRMEAAGMQAKISSIHVNGWFGRYDKLSTTRRCLVEEFGSDIDVPAERARWIFVGDSPNDAPMFGWFPNAVGVANVRGNLHSIVDLNAFLRQESTAHDAHSRVLLLGQRFAFNAGLLVSRVLGLRNTDDWEQVGQDGATQYKDAGGQVWRKLDIDRLLSQPEFLQIGE